MSCLITSISLYILGCCLVYIQILPTLHTTRTLFADIVVTVTWPFLALLVTVNNVRKFVSSIFFS